MNEALSDDESRHCIPKILHQPPHNLLNPLLCTLGCKILAQAQPLLFTEVVVLADLPKLPGVCGEGNVADGAAINMEGMMPTATWK